MSFRVVYDSLGYEIHIHTWYEEWGECESWEYADPYWEYYDDDQEPDEAWDIMYDHFCELCGEYLRDFDDNYSEVCQECLQNK